MILSLTRQDLRDFHLWKPDEAESVEFPAQCGDGDEAHEVVEHHEVVVVDEMDEESHAVDAHREMTREVALEMVPERNQK